MEEDRKLHQTRVVDSMDSKRALTLIARTQRLPLPEGGWMDHGAQVGVALVV